jgi:hypothetical protein
MYLTQCHNQPRSPALLAGSFQPQSLVRMQSDESGSEGHKGVERLASVRLACLRIPVMALMMTDIVSALNIAQYLASQPVASDPPWGHLVVNNYFQYNCICVQFA